MKTNFPYAPFNAKKENKQIRDWRLEFDPDTVGFSKRFYAGLTIGFAIVITGILFIAPSVDTNPLIYLSLLTFIALALWAGINWSANRSRNIK